MTTLKVLQELQAEINDYCDPNEKVSAMIKRFIQLEIDMECQRETFMANMSYELEQRATERTSHDNN
jgi:hypothetical protein